MVDLDNGHILMRKYSQLKLRIVTFIRVSGFLSSSLNTIKFN